MKIVAIRGKNIASLEGDFEIDFAREPLLSSGIFAISGPTGAGKSSLLDTMCLALFARTPRSDQAKENEVKLLDVSEFILSQGDPRMLLRRGTASGYAETDFVALNGMRYRSRWSVRRARDRVAGALQDYRMSLYNLDAHKEEQGNKRELLGRISELIGLTFEQFTRSVLLAQNDFSTFLKADQREKAALLEKLTGTEMYSDISQLIYEKNLRAKDAYQQLYNQVAGIELLTEEEVFAWQTSRKNCEDTLLLLKKTEEEIKEKQQWFVDDALYRELLGQSREEAATSFSLWQQSQHRVANLQRVDQVQQARPLYEGIQTQEHLIQNQQQQQATVQNHLSSLLREQQKCLKQYELSIAAQQTLEEELVQQAPVFQLARKLDIQLEEASLALSQIELRMQEASFAKKQEEQRLQQLRSRQTSEMETIRQLKQWRELHIAKQQIAEQCDVLLIQLQRGEVACKNVESAKANIKKWKENQAVVEKKIVVLSLRCQEKNSEKTQLEASIRTLEEQLQPAVLEAIRQEIECFRSKREHYVHDQTLLLSLNMTALRSELQDGQACPLCGSIHHPYAGADEQLHQSFSSLLDAVDLKLKELKTAEAAYQQKQKQQASLYERYYSMQTVLATLEKERNVAESELAILHNKIVDEESILKQHHENLHQILLSANRLFENETWQEAWMNNPQSFSDKLKTFSLQWQRNKELIREKEVACERLRSSYESYQSLFPAILKREEEACKEFNSRQEQVSGLKKQRSALLNGQPVHEVETDLKKRISLQKDSVEATQSKLNAISLLCEQNKGTLRQIEQQLLQAEKQCRLLREKLTQWLHTFNTGHSDILSEEELTGLLSKDADWIQSEREALHLLHTASVTAEAMVRDREEKVKTHTLLRMRCGIQDHDTPQTLEENRLAILEQQHKQTEILNECNFRLRRNKENKEKIKGLQTALEVKRATSEQWGRLCDLAGSSDGAKLRRIAQGYTMDVLLSYANIQLQELSGRYRLSRVPETLALQVTDRDMCDEIRTVHSLSGGESFLVSLALALGLSSLSSNRMKVESLFIDEGFGSLDAETLRVAMDALDSLRMQGRKVGVISHVQEMTERIAIRINVRKESNGRSRIFIG